MWLGKLMTLSVTIHMETSLDNDSKLLLDYKHQHINPLKI